MYDVLLLLVLGLDKLHELPLHPLVLQLFHAVLLVKVYQLDLQILLLNVVIVVNLIICEWLFDIVINFKLRAGLI